MLKVYGFSRVNAGARGNTRDLRVLWPLEETGVPYEIVGMDHPNHDLDSAAYRAKNPQRLGELNGWLEGRQFVATDEFTVADNFDDARARRGNGPQVAGAAREHPGVSKALYGASGVEADARRVFRAG